MINFSTPTEKSFYNFVFRTGHKIVKINEERSPDFLVDNEYSFEIKAANISGTQRSLGPIILQNINYESLFKKFLGDAHCKIKHYSQLNPTKYFALVIYNLRPLIEFERIIIPEIKKIDMTLYPLIDSLIFAGYNKPSNLTTALHIHGKGNETIIDQLLQKINHSYII